MADIIRLEPPIWLHTPKGEALAYFLIYEGVEHDDYWKCIQQDTGEWWTWTNDKVHAMKNITMGRTRSKGDKCEEYYSIQRAMDLS